MNSLDILAAAAVELLGTQEDFVANLEAAKADQEVAQRVLRSEKVNAFVAKRVVEKREIRSRLCRKAPAVPVVKKHEPLNLNRLRRQAKRGPAVMMSFNAVREPPNPFSFPPLPGGMNGKSYYHGWLHRKTGMVTFHFDDEVLEADKLRSFEDLLQGPVPSFLDGTVPLITTRLVGPLPLWKHKYLDARGMVRVVALVGRT